MALRITADCITCGACDYVCPNNAIVASLEGYRIVAASCTECAGLFNVPQCLAACPVDCIVADVSQPTDDSLPKEPVHD